MFENQNMEKLNLHAAFIACMLLQTWSLSRSESVPFQMVWHDDEGYIPPSNGSSITCSQNHYIEIINIYGRTTGFNIDVKVTRTERFQIKQTCNCKTTCLVPAFLMQEKKEVGLFGLAVGLWKLHVEYRCIPEAATQYTQYIGCFKDGLNRDLDYRIEMHDQNTPQKCINACLSNGSSYSYAGVQHRNHCFCGNSYGKYRALPQSDCNLNCTGDQTQKCGGAWANAIYWTDPVTPCSIDETTAMTSSVSSKTTPTPNTTTTTTTTTTTAATTTTPTTTTSSTSGKRSTDLSTVISSEGMSQTDTVSSLASTNDVGQSTINTTQPSETVTSASRAISDETKVLTITTSLKGARTEPHLEEEDDSTIIVAVVVSTFILVVAVVVFLFLYRRWRRKNMTDAAYKNAPQVTNKNKDDGFTNMTYSKDTGNVKLQDSRLHSPDTNSNSGDSGYTDMHNEDSREADNDYCMIKENRTSNTDGIVNDQYYAIKDNVSSEYNKIAFKPIVIPDDPNYGHTL